MSTLLGYSKSASCISCSQSPCQQLTCSIVATVAAAAAHRLLPLLLSVSQEQFGKAVEIVLAAQGHVQTINFEPSITHMTRMVHSL